MSLSKIIRTLVIGSVAVAFSNGSLQARSNAEPPMEPRAGKIGISKPKIVGGQPATANTSRWITSLQYSGSHFCGGALIAPGWVLTAAHCLTGESASDPAFTVWVGGNDLTQPAQGQRVDVAEIIMHENYDDNLLVNDIALLRLAENINSDIAPVELASEAIMSGPGAPNQPVNVSGWGALSQGGSSPDVLHEVTVPVVSNATCNAPESYSGEITALQICAGLKAGGKDSCQGDSGGPLWLKHEDKEYHIGVVSFGDGCALPDKYGVYTRTQGYLEWIANKTGTEPPPTDPGQCTEPPGDGDSGGMIDNGATLLFSGDQKDGLQGNIDDTLVYAIEVEENAFQLAVDLFGGSGDADLYVAHNRIPTTEDFDFSPFLEGNDENVTVQQPSAGRWYIVVHGYDVFENVSLSVTTL